MKKKLVCLAICAAMFSMAACGTKNDSKGADKNDNVEISLEDESKNVEESNEYVSMSNPWIVTDKDGVLDATGFAVEAPEGATEVVYSYLSDSSMAQVSYTYEGNEWTYRIQPTNELTDISGMYYTWDVQEEGTVSGKDAIYYAYSDADSDTDTIDNMHCIHVVNWYDATNGVTYSLSAEGNLDGMDIQVYAKNIYAPL